MKKSAILIGATAIIIVVAFWLFNWHMVKDRGVRACTMEAKLCPDGSAVGRVGPNCEFSECPQDIVQFSSGVRGTVLLGPTCPVMRDPPDPQCADKSYVTTVTAHRDGTKAVFARTQSDVNGAFEFALPPGAYMLTAGSDVVFPRCSPVSITIAASGYATTSISCDTGIR